MALAEVCYPGRKQGQVRRRGRSRTRRQSPVMPGPLAEKMLREMAFVFQATRSIRESIVENAIFTD